MYPCPKIPIFSLSREHGFVDLVRDHQGGDRHVGGRESLRAGQHVRLELERLAPPAVAGPPEAADHLVGDEQHVVFPEHRLDLLEVGSGRDDDPTRPLHGLREEGGAGLRALGEDQVLEALRHAGRKRLLALPGLRELVVMGMVGVPEPLQGKVEVGVHEGLAGEAHRRRGRPVVALGAADDLLLLRLADGVVVVPDELDRGVVGLRPGRLEQHLRHLHRGDLDELLGKIDALRMRPSVEGVVVGQGLHLLVGDLREPLLAEAERGAPQSRHPLEVTPAGVVEDVGSVAPLHDEGTLRLVEPQVGLRVHLVGDVARLRRVGRHVRVSVWGEGRRRTYVAAAERQSRKTNRRSGMVARGQAALSTAGRRRESDPEARRAVPRPACRQSRVDPVQSQRLRSFPLIGRTGPEERAGQRQGFRAPRGFTPASLRSPRGRGRSGPRGS